jgi:site-specific recombinase XerD
MIKTNFVSIQQFRDFVELKDFRPRTKKEYVRYLCRLSDHYSADPTTLSEDQLRRYFLLLRQERQLGASAMIIAKASFQCFFVDLHRKTDWRVFSDLVIRRAETLPIVLSREDVGRILGVVREERFRICLRLIYQCGLRVGEAVSLRVENIDGKAGRIHVRDAKGGKDRYVPLSSPMCLELRQWWKEHRNPVWLFPSIGLGSNLRLKPQSEVLKTATSPMSVSSVQRVFQFARVESAIHPEAVVHTLRHSYATHLLEEGVSLRLISQYLGHASLDTTVIYTHLTAVSEEKARQALERLHSTLPR